ncbi:MAG: glycosyltransferase family 39 protein [Nanoarchaeota archaeon]|nr:glycosyltransferase family 39 protein [Nanoarchaeota archaeon]
MKTRYWLLLLVVVALGIRLLLLSTQHTVEIDGAYYVRMGQNLFAGRGLVDIEGHVNTVFMPLYPILIGSVDLLIHDGELSARLLSILFGVLLIFPVFLLGKDLYGRIAGLLAAGMVAIYPALAYISTITYTDSLFLFLITSFFVVAFRAAESKKVKYIVAAAVLIVLSYLCRPEALGFIPFFFVYAAWRQQWSWKCWVGSIVFFGVLLLVLLAPYFIWVYHATGDVSLSSKGLVIYKFRSYEPFSPEYEQNIFGVNAAKDDILLNPYVVKGSLVQEILRYPEVFILRYCSGFFKQLYWVLPKLFPFIIFSFAVLLFRKWKLEGYHRELFLGLMLVFPLLFYPIFWVEARYLLVLLPLLMVAAAKGVLQLADHFGQKVLWLFIVLLMACSLVGNVFAVHLIDGRFEKLDPPLEQKAAGLWVQEHYTNPRVMERKPWVSFYSGGIFVNFPYASYSDLIVYACKQDVDVVVIDDRYTKSLRPDVAFLLEHGTKELSKVYESSGKKLILYELACSSSML